MLGFIVSAVGALILGASFNLYTQAIDIITGTVVFRGCIGFLLSRLINLTMSAARKYQESDASSFLKAFKSLGYSIGRL
jgi:hypothetical protein